jgi:hypothetical protein
MAIFKCNLCGRLLYGPDELLGHAWQCPTCGSMAVHDVEEPPSSGLAELLEEEYRLGLAEPAGKNRGRKEISVEPGLGAHAPDGSEPERDAESQAPPMGQLLANPRRWELINNLVLVFLTLSLTSLGVALFVPNPPRDFLYLLAGVCFFGLLSTFLGAVALGDRANWQSKRFSEAYLEHHEITDARPDTELGPSATTGEDSTDVTTEPTDIRPGEPSTPSSRPS